MPRIRSADEAEAGKRLKASEEFAILDRLLITESTLNSVLFMVGCKQIVYLVPSLPNSMDFP